MLILAKHSRTLKKLSCVLDKDVIKALCSNSAQLVHVEFTGMQVTQRTRLIRSSRLLPSGERGGVGQALLCSLSAVLSNCPRHGFFYYSVAHCLPVFPL